MERIKEIIEQLQATSSRNEKAAILEANKDNELWTEVLKFLLDPTVVTGISMNKIEKYGNIRQERSFDLVGVLNYLRKHNTGRMEDVAVVSHYANGFPEHRD